MMEMEDWLRNLQTSQYPPAKGFTMHRDGKPLAPNNIEEIQKSIYFLTQAQFKKHGYDNLGSRKATTEALVKSELPNSLYVKFAFFTNENTQKAAFAAIVFCADNPTKVLTHIEETLN